MDWFEKLTGFRETDYDDTRGKLRVEDRQLKSLINGMASETLNWCHCKPCARG
jgi:hypothetical protein